VVQLALDCGALRPRDAGVGDEDIETSVEVADAGFERGRDGFEGDDVYLVSFTCAVSLLAKAFQFTRSGVGKGGLTLHTINLLNVLGLGDGFLVAIVPDRDIGTCFGQSMRYGEPDTCSCTGDDGSATFEGEEREDAVCDWRDSVVVGKLSVYHCTVHSGSYSLLRLV
jgi:hypothetical protein